MELPTITLEDIQGVYPNIPPTYASTVDAAILTAGQLIQNSIIANGCGASYTDDQLKQIYIWLAAHLYQVQRGILSSISAGSTSESYQMSTDFFLKGSLHGQNAMLLDTNHCLAQLMADTDQALQGRQSFVPSLRSLHSYKQRGVRRRQC